MAVLSQSEPCFLSDHMTKPKPFPKPNLPVLVPKPDQDLVLPKPNQVNLISKLNQAERKKLTEK